MTSEFYEVAPPAASAGAPALPRQASRRQAVLQLIRLPNCFTAVPDALAGGFVALWLLGGEPGEATAVVALVAAGLAGFLAYMGGVTMNDLVDRRHDAVHRPERPLPSGRVPVWLATALTVLPLTAALAIAAAYGTTPLVVAAALVGLIALYNVSHKPVPTFGLPLMGLSRAANALTGFAIVAGAATQELLSTHWEAWLLPGALALWVLSISVVAKLEGRYPWAVRLVPRMILLIALLDALLLGLITGFAWPLAVGVVALWILPATYLARRFRMS